MTRPQLTIALPTYNRAALLEQQLTWLERSVKGVEEQCRILIADNCSTDETPDVIERWCRRKPDRLAVEAVRRSENIGAVRNIAACIDTATTPHVWTISDDDEIADDAVPVVLELLEREADITLLLLNFSSRMHTGEPLFERCFDVNRDELASPGRSLFERFLRYRRDSRWGGLALTTALVYSTPVAQAAFRAWPDGLSNQLMQLFVSGFCAREGKMLVTGRTLLESVGGRAHFSDDPAKYFAFRTADTSTAFVKLAEISYSPRLCMRKLIERPAAFAKMAPRAWRADPARARSALGEYGRALAQAGRLLIRRPDRVR